MLQAVETMATFYDIGMERSNKEVGNSAMRSAKHR